MPLVLAIEPDPRQATTLKRVVMGGVHAKLVVVDSKDAALAAIASCVPDLILVTALLPPRDEDDLTRHLKALDNAGHLQTLTIPLFAVAQTAEEDNGGMLGRLRRKKRAPVLDGCDPKMFGEQVEAYLQRAAELREEQRAQQAWVAKTESEGAPVEAAPVQTDAFTPPPGEPVPVYEPPEAVPVYEPPAEPERVVPAYAAEPSADVTPSVEEPPQIEEPVRVEEPERHRRPAGFGQPVYVPPPELEQPPSELPSASLFRRRVREVLAQPVTVTPQPAWFGPLPQVARETPADDVSEPGGTTEPIGQEKPGAENLVEPARADTQDVAALAAQQRIDTAPSEPASQPEIESSIPPLDEAFAALESARAAEAQAGSPRGRRDEPRADERRTSDERPETIDRQRETAEASVAADVPPQDGEGADDAGDWQVVSLEADSSEGAQPEDATALDAGIEQPEAAASPVEAPAAAVHELPELAAASESPVRAARVEARTADEAEQTVAPAAAPIEPAAKPAEEPAEDWRRAAFGEWRADLISRVASGEWRDADQPAAGDEAGERAPAACATDGAGEQAPPAHVPVQAARTSASQPSVPQPAAQPQAAAEESSFARALGRLHAFVAHVTSKSRGPAILDLREARMASNAPATSESVEEAPAPQPAVSSQPASEPIRVAEPAAADESRSEDTAATPAPVVPAPPEPRRQLDVEQILAAAYAATSEPVVTRGEEAIEPTDRGEAEQPRVTPAEVLPDQPAEAAAGDGQGAVDFAEQPVPLAAAPDARESEEHAIAAAGEPTAGGPESTSADEIEEPVRARKKSRRRHREDRPRRMTTDVESALAGVEGRWLASAITALRDDIQHLREERRVAPAQEVSQPVEQAQAAPEAPATDGNGNGRGTPGAGVGADAPPPAAEERKEAEPIQDEWGLYNPERCGMHALMAKLAEQDTAAPKPPPPPKMAAPAPASRPAAPAREGRKTQGSDPARGSAGTHGKAKPPDLKRLAPLAAWAREDQWDDQDEDGPGDAAADESAPSAESLPEEVSAVRYGSGARIRRVRVAPAAKEPPSGKRQVVIVSKKALKKLD